MAQKKEKEIRYLPELEDRIAPVFDRVYAEQSSIFSLSEEEQFDMKRTLKFLISYMKKDEFVRKFNVNGVRKSLISADERVRHKGNLTVQVLRELHEDAIADIIMNYMAISPGVIDLTIDLADGENSMKECLQFLEDILKTLNSITDKVEHLSQLMRQFAKRTSLMRVTQSIDNAMRYLKDMTRSTAIIDDNKVVGEFSMFHYHIFVYAGNLERELQRAKPHTLKELMKKYPSQHIVCIYKSQLPQSSLCLSQEPDKYICRTLEEVADTAKFGKDNYLNLMQSDILNRISDLLQEMRKDANGGLIGHDENPMPPSAYSFIRSFDRVFEYVDELNALQFFPIEVYERLHDISRNPNLNVLSGLQSETRKKYKKDDPYSCQDTYDKMTQIMNTLINSIECEIKKIN